MANTPLSKYMKMLRKQHKYTQKDIADKIGTTRANYSHYETGMSMPSNDIFDKLSYIYNVPLVNFIKLSAMSGKGSLKLEKGNGKAGFDGLFADNPGSPSMEPLYIEFIDNCSQMSAKELKEWMEPEDMELVYYYHKLSEKDKRTATDLIRVLLRNSDTL